MVVLHQPRLFLRKQPPWEITDGYFFLQKTCVQCVKNHKLLYNEVLSSFFNSLFLSFSIAWRWIRIFCEGLHARKRLPAPLGWVGCASLSFLGRNLHTKYHRGEGVTLSGGCQSRGVCLYAQGHYANPDPLCIGRIPDAHADGKSFARIDRESTLLMVPHKGPAHTCQTSEKLLTINLKLYRSFV